MPMNMDGGFSALQSDFERMAAATDPAAANGALQEAAQPILEQMRANASSNPRAPTGRLRGALNANASKGGTVTIGVHRKEWGGDEYYAPYVEYGHGGPRPAPPHPFIRPAFDARADEALDILREKIADALK